MNSLTERHLIASPSDRIHGIWRRSIATPALLATFGLIAVCVSDQSVSAQTSYSQAFVNNGYLGASTCDNRQAVTVGGSSASCFGPESSERNASAITSSVNATRTVSSAATLFQRADDNTLYSNSQAISYQLTAIDVTGTPAPSDFVVFHFATPVFGGTAVGGNGTSAYWQLFFYDGTYGYSNAGTRLYGNGTSISTTTGSAQFTAAGVDITAQLTAFGNPNLLNFIFGSFATAGDGCGVPCGTQLTSSVTATLSGVDMFAASGRRISSASFNADGTGLIDLASTTPEPNSALLLGTGMVGLISFMRKHVRRSH